MDIKLKLSRSGHTHLSREDFFSRLADIPATLSHFPKLKPLTELAPMRYQWDLKPIGAAGIYHEVSFATDFKIDNDDYAIHFTAVKAIGNAQISGRFTTKTTKDGTDCTLNVTGTLHNIKVPLLLRAPAKPVIKRLFEDLVEDFVNKVMADYDS